MPAQTTPVPAPSQPAQTGPGSTPVTPTPDGTTAAAPASAQTVPAATLNGPNAGIGLVALGDRLPDMSNQSSFSLAVVSQDDAAAAAALPGRSLYYTAGVDVNSGYSNGVPWSQASANGWLLKDSGGNYLG